jgi:hypothetical protein
MVQIWRQVKMAHTITITSLRTEPVNGMDNVIVCVYYDLTTTNNWGESITKNYPCMLLGTQSETGEDISSSIDVSGFVNYADLSQETVVGWVENTETQLPTLLNGLSQTPVNTTPVTPALPWAS